MFSKKVITKFLIIILTGLLVNPAMAAMKKVKKFKNVNIPYNLKHEETIIEKGKYDFEIWAYREVRQWSVKLIKKGNTLCALPGVILRDECPGARGQESEDIPKEPTLKMSRIPAKHILNIIFEAGSTTQFYTCYKVKFEIQYEE